MNNKTRAGKSNFNIANNVSKEIKLIIADFDGTLVDTFDANLKAYQRAFERVGLHLSELQYKACFGLRFERFMEAMEIYDPVIQNSIRELKAVIYPDYFQLLKLNKALMEFIRAFRLGGGKTAVASTARKENLHNVLNYLDIADSFDYMLAGEDVISGKPNPEIFEKIINHFGVQPENTLIFEDTEVGVQAAKSSGGSYIKITSCFYGN